VSLGACGGSVSVGTKRTVDLDEVQASIEKQYAAQGIVLTDLDGKDGVELKTGAPIVCTAINDKGTILDIRGSVTSTEGGRGRFRVRTVAAIAKGPVIAARAKELLEQKFDQRTRSLTCPKTVPIPTRPSVTCELTTLDGLRYDATLTVNAQADLQIRVADRAKNGPTG
jgi:hypothetical protein